ncbi:Hsp20/alpha crystallin family protein [Aestuariicella hydrocarbonica]|uniref:Hsp20/alpha crystallin family protein n=1 Tax=Pseudomaricurvus hydrocarbonicus TaxID=1470433 RepID=A0A9E5MPK7_9GAMM|nr:Hsp20/alpha crystallin family protein [Aestuariicella hydrocarbonica]NHO68139.1 Hsp20/alpha crystallin family protein [Aestuariicella hydrocarbonica]
MSLIPRNSIFDFDNLLERFRTPELLSDTFNGKQGSTFSPRIEVREKDNQYLISAELPGIDKNDVQVTLEDGVLSIEAESHQEDKEEKDGRIIRQERRYGKFVRSFNLGSDIEQGDIDATFKNGILTLTVPKSETKTASSRRIDIH